MFGQHIFRTIFQPASTKLVTRNNNTADGDDLDFNMETLKETNDGHDEVRKENIVGKENKERKIEVKGEQKKMEEKKDFKIRTENVQTRSDGKTNIRIKREKFSTKTILQSEISEESVELNKSKIIGEIHQNNVTINNFEDSREDDILDSNPINQRDMLEDFMNLDQIKDLQK